MLLYGAPVKRPIQQMYVGTPPLLFRFCCYCCWCCCSSSQIFLLIDVVFMCTPFAFLLLPPPDAFAGPLNKLHPVCVVLFAPPSGFVSPLDLFKNKQKSCGDRRSRRLTAWAGFTCPYHGILRVRGEAPSRLLRGELAGHGEQRHHHHSATTSDEEEEQQDTRVFLSPEERRRHLESSSEEEEGDARLFVALADPREGMRSPCTLAVQIGAGDSAPVRSCLNSSPGDIFGTSPGFLGRYRYLRRL